MTDFIDGRLPEPFSAPQMWPAVVRSEIPVLLDLRSVCLSGGRLKSYFRSLAAVRPLIWVIPPLSGSEDVVVALERDTWIQTDHPLIIEDQSAPRLDWFRACFPETLKLTDDLTWRRVCQSYQDELGAEVRWYEDLRFFAKHFEKIAGKTVPRAKDSAGLEYARLAVLFSPQDETALSSEELQLNPTFLLVTLKTRMVALARYSGEFSERDVDWQDAQAIELLSEEGSLSLTVILSKLDEVYAQEKRLTASRTAKDVVDSLRADRVILGAV